MRLGPRREPARRQRADGDDHVRQARRRSTRPSGRSRTRPSRFPSRSSATPSASCRTLLDRTRRRAAVVDPRRARRDDARELRRLPPRGADGGAGRDRRRAARALRARRRRGQGRRLQQRPHAGARARLPARARRLHGRRRARAQGEPRRPRAAVRLPRPRRRELPAAHDRHAGSTAARSSTGSR